MMKDILDDLTVKVENLIEGLKKSKDEIARLEQERDALKQDATTRMEQEKEQSELQANLEKRNEELTAEVADLREKVSGYEGKEELIRNKLRTIIDRVEEVEGDIEELEG